MSNHTHPLIEITRELNKLHSVKVIMPIWKKADIDNIIYVNMPLLGLSTYGKNIEDTDLAIEETITAFCLASEKFGLGLESELDFFGWKRKHEYENSVIFAIDIENPFMEDVMDTGYEKAFLLDMPEKISKLVCA